MQHIVHRAADRGSKDLGWLLSKFSFSFSSYQNPINKGFGLLKVLNDDRVSEGGGFGLHAHVNMEIISIMLQGKMNHKDSLGYAEVVEKDWVQIMSAGSGLRHEEHNVGNEDVRFLQIWIEPKLQNITSRYQKRYFPKDKRRNKLQTIVSNDDGQAHCWINQNASLHIAWFNKGEKVNYTLNPTNKSIYVFVLNGMLAINNETLQERDSIGIWETESVNINVQEESEFLLIEVPINN